MDVPSFYFLGFALIGAVLINLSTSIIWRNAVFLVINLVFFSTFAHSLRGVLPFTAFLVAGYAGTVLLLRRPSTPIFLGFLALILFTFFDLKRYVFIPSALNLPFAYVSIGLSYVFFRVLHLLIDARYGMLREPITPVAYFNYTMNFTSLVSGPIQLYPDYRRSAQAERLPLDLFAAARAGERIVVGFFKVAIVSVLLQDLQQNVIRHLSTQIPLAGKIFDCGLLCAIYPLFLYANFSGYTDFVIGVARLYRLELPENFNNPFLSKNFIELWSRWHITLSNWLRAYVYTPLLMALMRRVDKPVLEPYLAVIAYFVTFFLVGAWHGQTSMFLFFGLLQGGGVAVNKLYQVQMTVWLSRKGYRALAANPVYAAFARGLTFTWFAFTLLWFWSGWSQLGAFAAAAGPVAIAGAGLLVWMAATAALALLAWLQARLEAQAGVRSPREGLDTSRYWRTALATALIVTMAAYALISNGAPPTIVYKNF